MLFESGCFVFTRMLIFVFTRSMKGSFSNMASETPSWLNSVPRGIAPRRGRRYLGP